MWEIHIIRKYATLYNLINQNKNMLLKLRQLKSTIVDYNSTLNRYICGDKSFTRLLVQPVTILPTFDMQMNLTFFTNVNGMTFAVFASLTLLSFNFDGKLVHFVK